MLYNLYADKLLQLDLVPRSVRNPFLAFISSTLMDPQ